MFVLAFVFSLVLATVELQPWPTSSCGSIKDSCLSDLESSVTPIPHSCENLCDGPDNCTLRIALILPENESYIVNHKRAKVEMQKAIVHAAELQLIPKNLNITYRFFDDQCSQEGATWGLFQAYSDFCAHVIFGPICEYCLASVGRVVKYFNKYGTPLITPGGFSFDFIKKKTECTDEFFMVINSGMVDYQSIAEFFYHIVVKHKWKKIAPMYEKYDQNELVGEQGCKLLMATVMEFVKKVEDFQYFDGDISLYNITYEKFLMRDVGVKFGIIPICASHSNTRKILIEAEKLGMTASEEYLFLSFSLYNDAPVPLQPWYDPDDTAENNERARKGYRSLLTFTSWIEAEHAVHNRTVDDSRGTIYLDGIYDGFLLYIHVVNDLLFPNKKDDYQVPTNATLRGVDVVSRMYGYQFQGKRKEVVMNCNGQRVAKYALVHVNESDMIDIVAEYSTLDKKMIMRKNISWISDTPLCGYDNSKCPGHITLITSIVVVTIILIFLVFFGWHYKTEMDIASMTWKINADEISTMKTGSQMTLAPHSKVFTDVVQFKNMKVAFKRLHDAKADLTRDQLIRLKNMKDLSNNYLVKFYGACLEGEKRFVLTEYCSRGSLEDVMKTGRVQKVVKLSFMQDLVTGMQYLHGTDIKYHGSLKSTNCVIDWRFGLKITDFGLDFLKHNIEDYDEEGDHYWKRHLWTAPEILKCRDLRRYDSRKNNHRYNDTDKQKADVYSFGIIAHEIYVGMGVFYLGDLDLMNKGKIFLPIYLYAHVVAVLWQFIVTLIARQGNFVFNPCGGLY